MDTISRRLLFRIGSQGFCLNLNEMIEVREKVSELIDYKQIDEKLFVVGSLSFRNTLIPVVDLARRIGISADSSDIALVLSSQEGNWALLVDKVEGFYLASEMTERLIPPLLLAKGWRCFDQLVLYKGVPYLRLKLSACYAGDAW